MTPSVNELTTLERTRISPNINVLQWLQTDDAAEELKVANELAAFIRSATTSLRLAIYDFRLKRGPARDAVLGALQAAAGKGVKVWIAYDAGRTPDTQEQFTIQGGDPAPAGNAEFLAPLERVSGVEVKAIDAGHQLMHSKYVVVNAFTSRGAVWMGSSNFTDDSWSRQDNNVLIVNSAQLAGFYANDFLEMFAQGDIAGTGKDDTGELSVDGARVTVQFSPGQGRQIDSAIAEAIRGARNRVYIASMVISSATILGAMQDALEAGIRLRGIYDGTEMQSALHQMENSQKSQAKVALFRQVTNGFAQKKSTPFNENSPHDFMHNKIAVVDNTVFTGSYNFSLNATRNAENNLQVEHPQLADAYVAYIEQLIERYS